MKMFKTFVSACTIFLFTSAFQINEFSKPVNDIGWCGYGYALDDSNTPESVTITGFFKAPDTQHGKRSSDRKWVYRVFPSYNSALIDRNTYIRSYKSKQTEVNQIAQFEDMCN
jgi:hypothetical protein